MECIVCGESDPLYLEDHHPDKKNKPKYTIPLCANHHRALMRGMTLEKLKGMYDKDKIIKKGKPIIIRHKDFVILMFINRI